MLAKKKSPLNESAPTRSSVYVQKMPADPMDLDSDSEDVDTYRNEGEAEGKSFVLLSDV